MFRPLHWYLQVKRCGEFRNGEQLIRGMPDVRLTGTVRQLRVVRLYRGDEGRPLRD